MTRPDLFSVLWLGVRARYIGAVMVGMLLTLVSGHGYGMGKIVALVPVTSTMTATCGNSNGNITVTGVTGGGTPPYLYSINGGPYQSSNLFPNLASGNYTISVEDAASPANTGSVIAGVGDIAGPVGLLLQPIAATCMNNDGQVDVIVTGGTPNYTFSANGG